MVSYHGTTVKRANQILEDNTIKIDAERYYIKDKSGGGYTTPGFLYFTNEVTFPCILQIAVILKINPIIWFYFKSIFQMLK